MGDTPLSDLDPATRELIRHKARRLHKSGGFDPAGLPDREDLEQELTLHVLAKGHLYGAHRASRATFVSRILDRKVTDLWRGATAARRGRGRTGGADHLEERAAADNETTDLRLDVLEAVATLPGDLRDLAAALMTGGVAEASRSTGRTRGQVRYGCLALAEHLRHLDPSSAGTKNNSPATTNPPVRPVNNRQRVRVVRADNLIPEQPPAAKRRRCGHRALHQGDWR